MIEINDTIDFVNERLVQFNWQIWKYVIKLLLIYIAYMVDPLEYKDLVIIDSVQLCLIFL